MASNNVFTFTFDANKKELLELANTMLNITNKTSNKIIFIYSKPKVGSTSLVTSIRLFASRIYNVIHIHDELMLKVLGKIENITINEIILFNKYIGKEVFVIDVYRSPIERKISTFFEKIDSYHFNNTCQEINSYDIRKLITRFNKIFEHIGNGDNFLDVYNIPVPEQFDYENKFLFLEINGIRYIKLRLKDSDVWDKILTTLLSVPIKIVKDYETSEKNIKDMYNKFKENYKIPINFLTNISECKYLQYYYSSEEIKEYIELWNKNSSENFVGFTRDEYNIYEYISLDNNYMDIIQTHHYLDEGCCCKACCIKRENISTRLLQGDVFTWKIHHNEAKQELINIQLEKCKNINNVIKNNLKNKKNSKHILGLQNIVGLR